MHRPGRGLGALQSSLGRIVLAELIAPACPDPPDRWAVLRVPHHGPAVLLRLPVPLGILQLRAVRHDAQMAVLGKRQAGRHARGDRLRYERLPNCTPCAVY